MLPRTRTTTATRTITNTLLQLRELASPADQDYKTDMVKIEIEYKGQLQTEAVHTPSGSSILTDAPVDNGGKGSAFSPTDLVATALGTCMVTIMGMFAE